MTASQLISLRHDEIPPKKDSAYQDVDEENYQDDPYI